MTHDSQKAITQILQKEFQNNSIIFGGCNSKEDTGIQKFSILLCEYLTVLAAELRTPNM